MANLNDMIRQPAVEGRFYGNSEKSIFSLFEKIEKQIVQKQDPLLFKHAIGCILPHAGHIYSAYQTIPLIKFLADAGMRPETIVIINPNHTGLGPHIALEPYRAWDNCIGRSEIDTELNDMLEYSKDLAAQRNEHSAEVLLPYFQYYFGAGSFRILPVCLRHIDYIEARQLAKDLKNAADTLSRKVLVVASSDFSHFLAPAKGKEMDDLVLDKIEEKDVKGVKAVVEKHRISVCGYLPILTLMEYAELEDENYDMKIIARGHSGEVHPSHEVVDYISILFHKKP